MRTGRPKKEEEERLSRRIQVRLQEHIYGTIEQQAEDWGVTISSCTREILEAWAMGDAPGKIHCRGNKMTKDSSAKE